MTEAAAAGAELQLLVSLSLQIIGLAPDGAAFLDRMARESGDV
ncbi:hypothetical protein [Bradyrhizobium campsiandrae]|nr:hypothetical protein [Bradyrhizobium campsiandrae]